MSNFFVPYGKWVICHALKDYLESLIFPIPNTDEAIPGKSLGIADIIVGTVNAQLNNVSIVVLFHNDWSPNNLEFELVEKHLSNLLKDWNKVIDFKHNGIEFIGNTELMTNLGNFLRMGGYIVVK